MRRALRLRVFVPLMFVAAVAQGEDRPRAAGNQRERDRSLDGARTETYKTVGDVSLRMYIFTPPDHGAQDRRAAIVFFFGGGWRNGSPGQFAPHCRYLASRGMVAMAAEYRVHSRHEARVADCVADAKSAIRWVRKNAERLGVDTNRIASGGGSAGGHLAAAVGTLEGFDEGGEDDAVSARPNAMLLFNPALDLRAEGFGEGFRSARHQELVKRMGAEPPALSPTLHISKDTPPAIIFHGRDDATVPFSQAESFAKAMQASGVACMLEGAEGAGHGYFNFGRDGNKAFVETLRQADRFLVELGYLEGEATIAEFVASGSRQ